MNPEVLPAGPEDARYTVTVHIDAAALDRTMQDTTWRRTRMGMPLARKLQKAGYVVEDWRNAFQCASVIARESADGKLAVTVTAPRPHVVPAGELNPEESLTVEYVGGVQDGYVEPLAPLDPPMPVPPSLAIAMEGSIYSRWAYDLSAGVWLYRRMKPEVEGPVAHDPGAEVEDDSVWEDED